MAKFPSEDWVLAVKDKLNSDEQYARIAKNWEGDIRFVIDPDENFEDAMWIYFDLWHGKCRNAQVEDLSSDNTPAFILSAPYKNMVRVLKGEIEPMSALLSRKIHVHGNMAVLMRNVPTVLDFVRCCQEVTDSIL